MKKCVNATHGSRRELVSQIAGVESLRMALDAAQARVMEKVMRDPSYIDDLWKDDGSGRCIEEGRTWDDINNAYLVDDKYTSVLTAIMGKAGKIREEGNERISWGGDCAKNCVPEIDLNCSPTDSKSKWKRNIEKVKEGNWVLYSNGSKNEEGKVGSGWVSHGGRIQGKEGLGKLVTVWDGEVKAVAEALSAWDKSGKVIVLSDSQATIAAIKKAGKTGKARTGELRKLMRKIEEGRKAIGHNSVSLGWVKSHIGIKGNEEADKKAKLGADEEDPAFLVVIEGGLKEAWKKMRKEERCVRGTGEGRVVRWERKARVSYVHCRTNKGMLRLR